MGRRLYSALASLLGAVIGTGCDDKESSDPFVAEYGMPSADYEVSGTVTDTDGMAIENILLTLAPDHPDGAGARSGPDGSFWIARSNAFLSSSTEIEATDDDGPDHGGEFETERVSVTLTQTESGSGTWDDGRWEAHDVVIELDRVTGAGGAGGSSGGAGGAGGSTGGAGGSTGGAGGGGGSTGGSGGGG